MKTLLQMHDMSNLVSHQLNEKPLMNVGVHCVLELYDCSPEHLNDRPLIAQALREAAKLAESTLLGEVNHQFTPQGVTALALLAESHISIHTWPENGYAAVDVFTCGEHTKPEAACQYLAKVLQAGHHVLLKFPRRRMMNPTHQTIQDWELAESSE
jgi:S-adenosylmethionine decarboxylase